MTRMRWLVTSAAVLGLMAGQATAADKHKIFLSMSYIGNDWQAEAANMVNAMAQQGAEAVVVYPISPSALNQVVKNACDKGVMIIAYDAEITEPCAYNVSIDQEEAGRVTAEWLVDKLAGKGNNVAITGVPGTSVDTLRTKAAKEVFA